VRSLLTIAAVALAGCATGTLDWRGDGAPGTPRSAEWIRYTTTSDLTFSRELTLSFFVQTNVAGFCGAYQDAVAAAFDVHTAYLAAREPFVAQDETRNPQVCELTLDYYEALADAVDPITPRGAFYLSTTFGTPGASDGATEEGAPQVGTFGLTDDPLAESGDFFRTQARFFTDNPYRAAADALDCTESAWGYEATDAYVDYVGEPADGYAGSLEGIAVGPDSATLAISDALLVTRDRSAAAVLGSEADYLLCEITAHEFFLRVFER